MTKYFLYVFLLMSLAATVSCGSGAASSSGANTDAVGDADSLSPYYAQKSEQFVKVIANGNELEFAYAEYSSIPLSVYEKDTEKNAFFYRAEAASNDKMKEKIMFTIAGIDLEKTSFPLTLPRKDNSKKMILNLLVQKSNVFINYNNNSDFDLTLTAYKDGVLEGNFNAEVKNSGNRVIRLEKGTFKLKATVIDRVAERAKQGQPTPQ